MRIILTYLIIGFAFTTNAQLNSGIYQSTGNSFRLNYYLVVSNDSVIFYGWELSLKYDTIYFRSNSKYDSVKGLIFSKFEFTRNRFDPSDLSSFAVENDLSIEPFSLHRYFFASKLRGQQISFLATKDIYDSRADEFVFQKIR